MSWAYPARQLVKRKDVQTNTDNLRKIFVESELHNDSVILDFRITASDGKDALLKKALIRKIETHIFILQTLVMPIISTINDI